MFIRYQGHKAYAAPGYQEDIALPSTNALQRLPTRDLER